MATFVKAEAGSFKSNFWTEIGRMQPNLFSTTPIFTQKKKHWESDLNWREILALISEIMQLFF